MACSKLEAMAIDLVKQACGNDILASVYLRKKKAFLRFLHLKPTYRFEYCSWTHNDRICEFIHQERAFITKDKSCKGSRTKLNFVGKALEI